MPDCKYGFRSNHIGDIDQMGGAHTAVETVPPKHCPVLIKWKMDADGDLGRTLSTAVFVEQHRHPSRFTRNIDVIDTLRKRSYTRL